MKTVVLLSSIVMSVALWPVLADAANGSVPPVDLEQRYREAVQRYEHTLQELQQRLEALESQSGGSAGPERPAATGELEETVLDLADEVESLQTEIEDIQTEAARLSISLYVTLEYENFRKTTQTFDAKRVELLIGAQLTDRIKAFTEIEFERTATTESGPRQGAVEVEQGWLEYDINPWIRPRFGVMLVPFGRFNLNHFDPVRDLTARPIAMRRIVPTTWAEAGAGFTGSPFFGDNFVDTIFDELSVDYQFYLMNGLTNGISDTSTRGARGAFGRDNNANKAFVGRVQVNLLPGIEIGGSGYVGTYDASGRTMSGFDADWKLFAGPWELIGEYAWFDLENGGTQRGNPTLTVPNSLHGGYAQVNYHFWFEGLDSTFLGRGFDDPTFTGIVRYGHAHISDDNDAGAGANKEGRVTIGLNYRPVETVAFKMEYQFNHTKNEALERGDLNGFIASVTGAF